MSKDKTKKKDETKQSFKEVWSNNFFLLKLIFTASPAFLTLIALDSIRGQVSIFFEHVVGIGYVLEAAEFNYPFKRVATIILLLALAISVGMIFTVFVGDYIAEKERPKVVLTWAPHPRVLPQAVPNSFADFMNEADVEFVITHPKGYELCPDFVRGAKIEYDQRKAFEGADFIYAKNWSAYNDGVYGQILSKDMSWTVDTEKMKLTNNAFFMHCLPVRRNMIVTDDVIESERSIVIPEAANRVVSAQTGIKRILQG